VSSRDRRVARQGQSFGGIVKHVMGPRRAEEHVDQRVVAAAPIEVPLGVHLDTAERLSLRDQLGLAFSFEHCDPQVEVNGVGRLSRRGALRA
jgi:hypothetical protein